MAKEIEVDLGDPGLTLYAKPAPLNVASWATGVVALAESGTRAGYYSADIAEPANAYFVFLQAGASPASDDISIFTVRDPLGRRERHRQIANDTATKRADVVIEGVP